MLQARPQGQAQAPGRLHLDGEGRAAGIQQRQGGQRQLAAAPGIEPQLQLLPGPDPVRPPAAAAALLPAPVKIPVQGGQVQGEQVPGTVLRPQAQDQLEDRDLRLWRALRDRESPGGGGAP